MPKETNPRVPASYMARGVLSTSTGQGERNDHVDVAPRLASIRGTAARAHARLGSLHVAGSVPARSALGVSYAPRPTKEGLMARKNPRVTLLELVQAVQDSCRSDAEVVAVITHLVNTRRIILRGTFASARITTA